MKTTVFNIFYLCHYFEFLVFFNNNYSFCYDFTKVNTIIEQHNFEIIDSLRDIIILNLEYR